MRLVPRLAPEFEEICTEYSAKDAQGKDIVTLVRMFADEYDHFTDETDLALVSVAWERFLQDHKHQVTMPMVGMMLYLLLTYWPQGQLLYTSLPVWGWILVRDTVQEISDEIERRSQNGNEPVFPE